MRRALGSHQAVLYEVEQQTIAGLGRRWSTVREVREYVADLIGSEWFYERWPGLVSVGVERRGSGARWSLGAPLGPGRSEGVILLAPGALAEPVVLHELAHLAAPPGAGHTGPFAEVYLTLVRHRMGFEAWASLHYALRARPEFAGLREGAFSERRTGSSAVM